MCRGTHIGDLGDKFKLPHYILIYNKRKGDYANFWSVPLKQSQPLI